MLFVVSHDALDRYESLKRIFASDKRVMVILDRRSEERRKTPSARDAERRRADRRSRSAVDDGLRRQGWAMARREAPMDPGGLPDPIGVDPAKSILVVDDNPMIARLLEDILTGDGHRVTTARNGVEALALLADQAFDLLLVDIQMPEHDGPALYRELERRDPEHARRVMFMTGGVVRAETAALLSAGRRLLLRKPLEVEEFCATVQRFFLAADNLRRHA